MRNIPATLIIMALLIAPMGALPVQVPPPPSMEQAPQFLPQYDIAFVVVDNVRRLPVQARVQVIGFPQEINDWWGSIRTLGDGRPAVVRFSAKGFRSVTRVMFPGVHEVVMMSIRKA